MSELWPLAAAAAVLAVVAAGGLVVAIGRLRSNLATPPVATAAVAPEQDLVLPSAGDWVLHVEGPLFTTAFAGIHWELIERATGVPVTLHRVWLREHRSSLSRARLALRRFTTARAGTYLLRTTGLDRGREYGDCRILVVRPGGLARITAVAAVAGSAVALLTGVVATIVLGVFAAGGHRWEDIFERIEHGGDAGRGEPVAEPAAPVPGGARPERPAADDAGGGRRLRDERQAAQGWHAIAWPAQHMTAEVPAGWTVRSSGAELDVRYSGSPPAYLVAHVTPPLPGISPEQLHGIHRTSASEQLAADGIDGWRAIRLGALPGVLTIERRGEGRERLLVWNGVRGTANGAATVTLLLGVNGEEFDALEPVLGAILASIRFEG